MIISGKDKIWSLNTLDIKIDVVVKIGKDYALKKISEVFGAVFQ